MCVVCRFFWRLLDFASAAQEHAVSWIVRRCGYTLLFFLFKRHLGSAERKHFKFRPDPGVPELFTAHNDDYLGSGWSRGHMAPAGDNKFSEVFWKVLSITGSFIYINGEVGMLSLCQVNSPCGSDVCWVWLSFIPCAVLMVGKVPFMVLFSYLDYRDILF